MRKQVTWLIVGGLLAVVVAGTVDALRGSRSDREPVSNELSPDSSPSTGSTEAEVENACHTTRSCWARDVALAAGFLVVGDAGSAWVIRKPGDIRREILYFWATPAHTSGLRRLRRGYRRVGRLGEIAVLGDGVRLAWKLRRVTAWIEADGPLPKLSKLNPLVATSSTWSLSAASGR